MEAIGSPKWQQAVGVDRLELNVQGSCCRIGHAGMKERRVLIADHDAGSIGERGEQTPAGTRLGLDVREIRGPGLGTGARIVGHAVDHEAVESVAGPLVAAAQRLEHEQRPVEFARPVDRVLQREIGGRASRRCHPVEDVVARVPYRGGVALNDAIFRNGG